MKRKLVICLIVALLASLSINAAVFAENEEPKLFKLEIKNIDDPYGIVQIAKATDYKDGAFENLTWGEGFQGESVDVEEFDSDFSKYDEPSFIELYFSIINKGKTLDSEKDDIYEVEPGYYYLYDDASEYKTAIIKITEDTEYSFINKEEVASSIMKDKEAVRPDVGIVKKGLRSSKGITPGSSISYTSYHLNEDDNIPTRIFSGGGLTGTCCQAGVNATNSGTASTSLMSNSSTTAKIAYYYGYQNGWLTNQNVYPGFNTVKYSLIMQSIIQASIMGVDTWAQVERESAGYDDHTIQVVTDIVNNAGSLSNAPNSFQVFFCTPADGSQLFVLWGDAPTGKLKVSKTVSAGDANQSFTFNITVAGASGTYSGVSFSNGKATITLKGGQSKTIEGLPASASYSVTETTPTGWKLESQSGNTGTIPENSTASASFTNRQYGKMQLKKVSANTDITG